MITDVLFKRYPEHWLSDSVPSQLATLIRQAALVLHEEVAPHLPDRTRVFAAAQSRLARELGATALAAGASPEEQCMSFFGERYDLWNDRHGDADRFFKRQLSLVELLFQEAEEVITSTSSDKAMSSRRRLFSRSASPRTPEDARAALRRGVEELNHRLAEASLPLQYHNGLIQRADDPLATAQIEQPFWSLVAAPKWKNVDADIKEAIDRRDAGKSDAAFHALKALESALKILSDDLGRTRGTERGASEYIDNLVAERPERFIATWESDILKKLFRDLRNPQGHGPGSSAPLALTPEQTTYAIETAMSWVKSLVRRRT